MGFDGTLKAIRKIDLDSEEAMRIADSLKDQGLIDIAAVKTTGRGRFPLSGSLKISGTTAGRSTYGTAWLMVTGSAAAMPENARTGSNRSLFRSLAARN
jgi:hypothetical protein